MWIGICNALTRIWDLGFEPHRHIENIGLIFFERFRHIFQIETKLLTPLFALIAQRLNASLYTEFVEVKHRTHRWISTCNS